MTVANIGEVAARTYTALVHHPVLDRAGTVVTTAITNLDLHDIARSSRTYGVAGYFVVTPITAQRALAERILGYWAESEGAGNASDNPFRRDALARVIVVPSVDDAVARIRERAGAPPLIVATSARASSGPRSGMSHRALVERVAGDGRPLLLLFGTGWGLAKEVLDRVDHTLTPVRGPTDYNHLSVRSAAAIVLDRLFGDRD